MENLVLCSKNIKAKWLIQFHSYANVLQLDYKIYKIIF